MSRFIGLELSLVVALIGCGEADDPPASQRQESDPLTVTAAAPLVIKLTPSSDVRAALGDSKKGDLRLTIHGVSAPPGEDVRIRVFVNTPNASAKTGKDVPGFVGNVNFSHDSAAKVDFHLDPTSAFKRLASKKGFDPQGPVSVTLVLAPLHAGHSIPADAKVTVMGAKLAKAESSNTK
jgi:hypothetical protein